MTYRAPAEEDVLVASNNDLLFGVDPKTGQLRWQQRLPSPATKLFRVGRRLFVGSTEMTPEDARLRCFDLVAGTFLGEIALGFGVKAGFVRGDFLFVAGGSGFACLTAEGAVVWKALRVVDAGWVSSKVAFAGTDAAGNELWRSAETAGRSRDHGEGLLLGDDVAQPDMRGDASLD